MGLDGSVFLSWRSLPERLRQKTLILIEETGQWDHGEHTTAEFKAHHERLGNVASIAAVRNELEALGVSEDSVLLSKVFYSGSHSGDTIERQNVPRMSDELRRIRAAHGRKLSESTVEVLNAVERLCDAALRENNPIVFT